MMYDEFVKLVGTEDSKGLTMDDYKKVETVYLYHPYYSTMGKPEIAKAYKVGGMGLIEAMLPAAKKVEEAVASVRLWDEDCQKAHKQLFDYDEETEKILKARKEGREPLYAEHKRLLAGVCRASQEQEALTAAELEKFEKWANKLGLVEKN